MNKVWVLSQSTRTAAAVLGVFSSPEIAKQHVTDVEGEVEWVEDESGEHAQTERPSMYWLMSFEMDRPE